MIEMKASEIAHIVGGVLFGDDVLVTAPAFISSRDAIDGSIFCAFKGENVDGHAYIEEAFARGAVLALVSEKSSQRCVVVDNVERALGVLAHHVRMQLPHLQVVGITGSQGKTTTKELTRAILSPLKKTVAPEGNFNNEIGVPLTLLQCTPETEVCIVEMGARHIGDIAALVAIAQPTIGVVLRVAEAHLGEFGSIDNIARAKSEMVSALPADATAILGSYDPHTIAMKSLHTGKVVTFGEDLGVDIRATDIELREGRPYFELVTSTGRTSVELRVIGSHQVANALAAAAISDAVGITLDQIAAGLSTAENHAAWRMELHELPDLLIINDAYNASPDSMVEALRTLRYFAQERGGESWAFVGMMRELGEGEAAAHQAITQAAADLGIDHLVVVAAPIYGHGENTTTRVHHVDSHADALSYLDFINRGDVVLCKASRSEHFEILAQELEAGWMGKVS
jgi:UDP-N-acetylmuramoyl-tripeptide--D-alanyl-D-alanine ligase